MAYTAGAASVHITPDLTDFHRTVGRKLQDEDLTFKRAGDRWGSLSADSFKAKWSGVNVKPDIKPKLDDTAARAGLDTLTRDRKVGVNANVNDLKAKTELGLLTRDRTVTVDVKTSALSKLKGLFGAGGGAGGGIGGLLSGAASSLPGFGSLGAEGGSAGGLVAAVGLVPGFQALLVEVTGLVSGFSAAAAGAGAFGALAIPTFSKVSGALSGISKDTAAYNNALTKTARNTAAKKLAQDWKNLDPAQRQAVKGVQSLEGEYHKLSSAFQPQVMTVFNDGLTIANHLLPTLTPFANTFANSLDGLLKRFDKFTQSKGFKDWLAQFQKLEGPSITAIGNGVGKVATSFGKLLTILSAKDDVNAINIAFGALAGSINFVSHMVNTLRTNWDSINSGFDKSRHFLATAGHDIASGFLGGLSIAIRGAQDFTHAVLTAFGGVVHGADILFGNLPGFGWLKTADKEFGAWRNTVDKSFTAADADVNRWKTTLDRAPKTAKLKGDITDLTRKLATAKSRLKDPALTATKRAKIQAVISQLEAQIAKARRELAGINGTTATTYVQTVYTSAGAANYRRQQSFLHLPGHASGTPSAAPGWAMVGERGPELVRFRGGETVLPNSALRVPQLAVPSVPQVRGGDGSLTLRLAAAGNDRLLRAIVDALRVDVQANAGGNVQAHLGRGKTR